MTSRNYRTMFLKEFTRELVANSKKETPFFVSFHPVKQEQVNPALSASMPSPMYAPMISAEKEEIHSFKPAVTAVHPVPHVHATPSMPVSSMPSMLSMERHPIPKPVSRIMLPPQAQFQAQFQAPVPEIVSPVPLPLPVDFSLGKVDSLIDDNKVTSIECPGPGKLVLVRSLGKISATQIILSEEEIKKIIEIFSKSAKIPLLGGIFKAAIGNLVITAVISDFVGSRFIINKHTPYSLLEQAQIPMQFPQQAHQAPAMTFQD